VSAPFVTKLHRGPRALVELTPGWRQLQQQVRCSPMVRLEWTQAYTETFLAEHPDALWIMSVEADGQLVAIAPMRHRRKLGVPLLETIAVTDLYEPTDLLYRDVEALEALLQALLRPGLPLVLERQPLNSPTIAHVVAATRKRAVVLRRPRPSCPSITLEADPERILNAGRRSDLRRAHRKAEKHGPVRTEVKCPTPDELPALLATAFAIEAAGWKGAGETSLLHEAETRAFFERYARLAADAGILRLAFMSVGERPIAMHFDVECGGSLWLLKIGYDEAFASCSPGNLLMMEVLRYAAGQGLKTCEFLGTAAPWTKAWTTLEHPSQCVTIYSPSLPSAAHLALRAVAALTRPRKAP